MAVNLLGIGKPGHRRIAKGFATQFDNALIAAVFAPLIDGEGDIATAKKRRHTGRHAGNHIRTELRGIPLVKGGIAAQGPVRGHVGKKRLHISIALGL